MDALCALAAADAQAHVGALLETHAAEAAVDACCAMLAPQTTLQSLVLLGMLARHGAAQRCCLEHRGGALLPTLLAIRRAPGAEAAAAIAAQLFAGLAQAPGAKERVAAALRADMEAAAADEAERADGERGAGYQFTT